MSYQKTYSAQEIKLTILLALVIANPFILFMLFKNLVWVGIISVIVFLLLTLLFSKVRSDGLRIYGINFLVLLSIFIHFELVFQSCFPEYIIEDLYSINNKYLFNKPNLYKNLNDKEYSIYYITNTQGFRIGGMNNPEKKVESCDWFFIGDSFTQGAQVNFEELYTSQLYKYYPDKVILNAGVSGLGIGNEYYMFLDMGKKLKPKKVFLQLCNFNDFMNVEPVSATFIDYLMSYSNLARSLLFNFKYVQPNELPIGRWTEPFYKTAKENSDYNIFYLDKSEKQKKDIADFEKYLKLFKDEVTKSGAELIVILIPTKEQLYYKDFKEVIDNFHLDVRNIDLYYPNKLLHQLAGKYGIRVLDPLDAFRNENERLFFEYDEHLNTSGHKVLAKCISNFVVDTTDNRGVRFLSMNYYGDRYPQLNQNGDTLVYQSLDENNMELMVSDTGFNSITRLTTDNVDEIHPIFSKDNRYIAYTIGDQSSLKTKIEIIDRTNGSKEIVTSKDNEFGAIPSFSPDNKYLTYAGWFFDPERKEFSSSEIILFSMLDKSKRTIIKNQYENWRPVFSPDEKKIAFISRRNSNYDIYVYDLLDKRIEQITNNEFDEWDPNFSPDGKKLIFARKVHQNWDLFEINIETLQERQVTFSLGDEWDPIYSRDGTYLYYAGEFSFFGGIFSRTLR